MISLRGDRRQAGQRGPDHHDRLAQRDEDERLAALGEVIALDGPVPGLRPAEARGVEADQAAEHVDGDRRQPEQFPGVPGDQPARHGERAADHAPGQDALVVALQALAAQPGDRETAPADLHEGVRAADGQPPPRERERQGGRHDQAGQGQREQHQPDRDPLGVQPVGDPGGVGPDQPHHGQQQQGLQRALDAAVVDQVVGQLGDREDVDQVEEQLDVGHAGARPWRAEQVPGRVLAGAAQHPAIMTRRPRDGVTAL